jgi:hypothetical protein
MSWAPARVHSTKNQTHFFSCSALTSIPRKDPNIDESTLVGTGTAPRGALDLDTFWEGLEREDPADGLPKVTGVARHLEANEIGSKDTM